MRSPEKGARAETRGLIFSRCLGNRYSYVFISHLPFPEQRTTLCIGTARFKGGGKVRLLCFSKRTKGFKIVKTLPNSQPSVKKVFLRWYEINLVTGVIHMLRKWFSVTLPWRLVVMKLYVISRHVKYCRTLIAIGYIYHCYFRKTVEFFKFKSPKK